MKIFCIGRNYLEHVKELSNEIPAEPVIFMKPENALLQEYSAFYYPPFTKELHYECELVLRICKNGKFIQESEAHNYYNAITVGIDFTARDIQETLKNKGLPWEKAKAFDNSAVLGKLIDVTEDYNFKNIQFSLKKNGEKVQAGNSNDMIFGFNSIIQHISSYFTINIGDLIFTGTPAGVGACFAGDELEGYLENEKLFSVTIK